MNRTPDKDAVTEAGSGATDPSPVAEGGSIPAESNAQTEVCTPHGKSQTEVCTPHTTWFLWIAGAASFAAVVLAVTPVTHSYDAIKVTLQFVLAPAAWMLLAIALLRRQGAPIHPWILRSLGAYCLLGLASTLLADFRWRAWQEWGFELCLISAFAVVAATATTARRLKGMCGFLYALACFTVALGLFHYFGGTGWLLARMYPDGGPTAESTGLHVLLYTLSHNRFMYSTFLSRDLFGAFLVMVVPLGWALFVDGRNLAGRLALAISGFLFVLCILLTLSNDSAAALIASGAVFAGLLVADGRFAVVPRRVRAIWAVGGALLLATAGGYLRKDVASAFRNLGDTVHTRGIIWGGALGIAVDFDQPAPAAVRRLFLGSGPGGFMLLFPHYRSPDYWTAEIAGTTLFPHSQPLGLLCERGALGLLAFGCFLGAILWLLFREFRRGRDSRVRSYQAALLAALVGATIQNLTSPNVRWTATGFTYWYVLGLAAAAIRLGAPASGQPRPGGGAREIRRNAAYGLLAASVALAVAAVPFGVRRFLAELSYQKGSVQTLLMSVAVDRYNAAEGSARESHRAEALEHEVEAEKNFKKSLEWLPSLLPSLYRLGYIYARYAALATDPREVSRACRQGKEAYARLIRYAPDYGDVHVGYGLHLQLCYSKSLDPRDNDQALRHLERAARMKSNLRTQWVYASALRQSGRLKAALEVERRILERATDIPLQSGDDEILQSVHKHLVEEAEAGGDRAELERLLEQKLEDDPHDPEAFAELVDSLSVAGKESEALALCAQWIERNPVDPLPRGLAVKILLAHDGGRQARLQTEALIRIQEARRPAPAGPWALPAPGRVAQWRDPDLGRLYFEAGRLAEADGLNEQARKYYERCVRHAPDTDVARRAAEALEAFPDPGTKK